MVATLTALGMAGAIAALKAHRLIPQLSQDPKIDAGIKAAIGLVLIVVAAKYVKNPWGKTAVIALGVGVTTVGIAPYVPFFDHVRG